VAIGTCRGGNSLPRSKQEAERGKDCMTLKGMPPCDLLPPTRSYLLKFPEPLKIAPPGGTKHSLVSLWGAFHIQAMTTFMVPLASVPDDCRSSRFIGLFRFRDGDLP
jgi:hypothetical protein